MDNVFRVPDWVADFESYRRWAHSPEYPNKGLLSYLNGEIWIDMTPEELFTHNQVRSAFGLAIASADPERRMGNFVPLGMFLTNRSAGLATEPDGMFSKWSTMKSGRLQMTEPRNNDFMELTGSPDVVLEIVSETSERRDKVMLKALYWKASIPEYWLVDARAEPAQFDILRHTKDGYVATPSSDGWLRSEVLGREFRLGKRTDPLGHPQYIVEVR